MMASTFTLAYLSIDRYLRICHARITLIKAIHPAWIILLVWMFSILFLLPFTIFCKSDKTRNLKCKCLGMPYKQQPIEFHFSVIIIGFYIPLLTMLFSYSQICIRLWGRKSERSSIENDQSGKKKRGIKMIILATSLFFIAWFPYTVLHLMDVFETGNKSIVG